MTGAAVMKAEDAAALVPFGRMLEAQKEAALAELTTQVARAGGAPGLVARLAGLLRRAPDGALFVELEVPRLSFFPSSKWIGTPRFEAWHLDLITKPLPGGLATDEAFWLAAETKILPLPEAAALVSGPDDPIAEMSRRRVEVERRVAERKLAGEAWAAGRAQDAAAQSSWLAKNAGRVRRWGELEDIFKSLATAAGESGDATLMAFVARVIELARTRNVQQGTPPEFLWPL